MNKKPVYAPFQQATVAMKEKADIFQTALIKSKNRAKETMVAKNEAQDNLFNALVRIAKLMDAECPTNDQDKLKTDAGFVLYKTPERSDVSFVEPPTNLEAYNDKRRGVIIVSSWARANNAVTTAFEMQEEGGTWKNGTYCEGEKMELTYPFGTKLWIRAKTVGPKLLTSEFTQPVDVAVS